MGVQQSAKETKPIAALKQHYKRYHADDLAALKELYEYHAENCVRAAELTVDPRRREEYLKLAREWTEAATTLSRPRRRRATRGGTPFELALDLRREAPLLAVPQRGFCLSFSRKHPSQLIFGQAIEQESKLTGG